MQERNVESIIIVFRRRDDGLVELGAITSAPAHGSVPVAPSMHDVRQMLDLAYNALMSVARKRLDPPS